jgi:Ras-related protein Rab-1A
VVEPHQPYILYQAFLSIYTSQAIRLDIKVRVREKMLKKGLELLNSGPGDHDVDYVFKFLLIGESGVGKSSILLRFTDDTYSGRPVSTIGQDFKTKMLDVGGSKIEVQVWDTAGQERFRTITSSFFRNAHGILMVYDITDPRSFRRLKNWMSELRRYCPETSKKIIVGNKLDLAASRAVSIDEVKALANENNFQTLEVSAKTKYNVVKAFEMLAKEVKDDWRSIVAERRASLSKRERDSAGLLTEDEPGLGCCC